MGVLTEAEHLRIKNFSEKQRQVFDSQRQRSSLRQAYNLAIMCDPGPRKIPQASRIPTVKTLVKKQMFDQNIFTAFSIEKALKPQGIEVTRSYVNEICRELVGGNLIKRLGVVEHGRYSFQWVGGNPESCYLIPYGDYARQLGSFKTQEFYRAIKHDFTDLNMRQCYAAVQNLRKQGVIECLKKDGRSNFWSVSK